MKTPEELKYTKTDEWVNLKGEEAIIGITDYAQDQLSDVVYVELMVEVDDSVSQGDSVATIESVKAAADVNFPVSGVITEINETLADAPEVLNSDPYEAGWMVKIKLDDLSEMDGLMDSEAYKAYNTEREG